MARTTFSVSFYARPAKASKKTGLTPLEMSIVVNGQRIFMNLPYKVKPEDFQKKRKTPEILAIEDQYRVKINDIILELMRDNQPITVNTIRGFMKTGGTQSIELKDLWDEYLTKIHKRVGISMKEAVYRKYELAADLCYSILGKNKEINSISNADMVELYETLKSKFKHTTAAGYFTKIKTVIVFAFENGMMKTNPTNGIRIDKGHPSIEYLTEAELKQIENANLHGIERLERVRDILLFQAYGGGMAYCDMAAFKPENMTKVGETYVYSGKRLKTGIEFTTVLLPPAIKILEKYNWELPMISNQKMNAFAKEIQLLAGIKKNIHTHLMRKSYASMLINRQVPITTICKCMGHSNSVITTKIYAHTQQETIAKEIAQAFI